MQIEKIIIKNFRLLRDVCLSLDKNTTVIVGRNNSGKTSLTELFRRLVSDTAPKFTIDDFSLSVHDDFWEAFILKIQNADENIIRDKIPQIETQIFVSYKDNLADLGPLAEFIIDLDPNSQLCIAVISYRLNDGNIGPLFEDINYSSESDISKQKSTFFKLMKERIPQYYSASLIAVDPTDNTNKKTLNLSAFRTLFQSGFINAQRGLDDTTNKEKDVLGKILGNLFSVTEQETASSEDRDASKKLDSIVTEIQDKIDTDFNVQLTKLLPVLSLFGYPGLTDPKLKTETTLDTKNLLDSNTKIRYTGSNGRGLPETYNGLGFRNLIYILFSLYEFFKSFQSKTPSPGIHIVFIEEPEAHLHPQMQEVFIQQLGKIAAEFARQLNNGVQWPVQIVVTTHSTHMANKAPFDSIRYFLSSKDAIPQTRIKDLRDGFTGIDLIDDREFLHKYLTLTRCDLFFADKAILIEGPTERILIPKMIEKVDACLSADKKLASQYLSVIEVGGAYAHHFYKFLEFLELRTLIITDLDSVKSQSVSGRITYSACKVSEGTHTSNAGIKKWFDGRNPLLLSNILAMTSTDKIKNYRRLAYQIPECLDGACGRSFEDAFMLANPLLFSINGTTQEEKADEAWEQSLKVEKTNFALMYAIESTQWEVPIYIKEGLLWLAENSDSSETSSAPPATPPNGGANV